MNNPSETALDKAIIAAMTLGRRVEQANHVNGVIFCKKDDGWLCQFSPVPVVAGQTQTYAKTVGNGPTPSAALMSLTIQLKDQIHKRYSEDSAALGTINYVEQIASLPSNGAGTIMPGLGR